MNNLYDNIIRDSEKSLEIIGKRAISIATSHVIQDGYLMQGSMISDWAQNITNLADLKGYYLGLTFNNLEVKAYDSFNLLIESGLTINITDKNGVGSIARNDNIRKIVSITGFEDPLYPLNTNGRITHKIYETLYENNFTQLLASGSGDNGWGRGISFAVEGDVSAANNCPNKSTTILVIQDPTQLENSVINQYLGVICDVGVTNETNIPYVSGISNVTQVIPNTTYVLADGDNDNAWYIENFNDHVDNGYYYTSDEGPSFLDRLEGELFIQGKYSSQTTNEIGMESFIDKEDFIAHELGVDTDKTNTDYMYFSTSSHSGSRVKGVNPYFRIDNDHAVVYSVDEILE